jgi:hypothetical protein
MVASPSSTSVPRAEKADSSGKSLIEVRVRTSVPEEGLGGLFQHHLARARLVACRASGSGSGARLLRWLDVEATPYDLQQLEDAVERTLGPESVAISAVNRGRAILRLSVPLPGLCAAVFTAGGVCVTCPFLEHSAEGGTLPPVGVLLPRNGEAYQFGRELARQVLGTAAIERMGEFLPRSMLTQRQDEALRAALELGYFEYPRRAELADVARALRVGRSATLELLRRAISRLGRRHYSSLEHAGERF